ncbi:hypothetical protein ACH5RR_018107 [Cinchona calisaya]|uniref:Reverse transcriptase zinc-binding domain-containing protein n=1 Tax=Cinchona calisaya TaxID=153742 RepID=A0ABD2ZKV9_9GENT
MRYKASWIWKNIIYVQDMLKKGACYLVKDGSCIRIWSDPWILSIQDFKPPIQCRDNVLVHFVADLISPETRTWNMDLFQALFPPSISNEIVKIKIPVMTEPDSLIWVPSMSGNYSVKSAYFTNQRRRFTTITEDKRKVWKRLWASKIHERHKFFLWKVVARS